MQIFGMNILKPILFAFGIVLVIDGVGSILYPVNTHNLLLDAGRVIRTLIGFGCMYIAIKLG